MMSLFENAAFVGALSAIMYVIYWSVKHDDKDREPGAGGPKKKFKPRPRKDWRTARRDVASKSDITDKSEGPAA